MALVPELLAADASFRLNFKSKEEESNRRDIRQAGSGAGTAQDGKPNQEAKTMFVQIESAVRQAAVNRQKSDLAVLKLLKSDILAEAKVQLLDPPTDEICRRIVQRHLKQYREAIALYDELDQPERAAASRQEQAVIEALLPPQLSADELVAIVAEEIETLQDPQSVSLGLIIKQIQARVGECSSPGEIAKVVKRQLGVKG